jgi:hypothetical protein
MVMVIGGLMHRNMEKLLVVWITCGNTKWK